MLESLLAVTLAGLQLWLRREDNYPLHLKQKLAEEFLEYRRKWYVEYEKPRDMRNNDALTRLEFKLRDCADRFALTVGSESLASFKGTPRKP